MQYSWADINCKALWAQARKGERENDKTKSHPYSLHNPPSKTIHVSVLINNFHQKKQHTKSWESIQMTEYISCIAFNWLTYVKMNFYQRKKLPCHEREHINPFLFFSLTHIQHSLRLKMLFFYTQVFFSYPLIIRIVAVKERSKSGGKWQLCHILRLFMKNYFKIGSLLLVWTSLCLKIKNCAD